MKEKNIFKKVSAVFVCILFSCNNVFALNAATDLLDHTSGVNPTTSGNITNITTTHNIDVYHWSSYNLAPNEIANYIFNANGQTALNYLSPGANASAIYGAIMSSGAKGNILLFNPNGIMMGAGASVSGANTFFASTNKFDGIVNGKVTFSEAEKNNPLTIGNISFNNVNNVHFVAPNVIVNADNLTTSNSISIRAIGGGEYDVDANLFSNEVSVKNPIANTNMLDVNANIESNKVTLEAKADADTVATALVSGEIHANKAVTGENGEVYIIASNDATSTNSGASVLQNSTITGDSAKVTVTAGTLIQNSDIDVSGSSGGSVNITASKDYAQNANILAKGTDSEGGTVDMNAKNITTASSATTDVSGKTQGGTIDIEGDSQIVSSGTYNASSSSGNGGKIVISAPTTKLFGASIDASGYNSGGKVYIGGPGVSGENIQKSNLTILSKDSIINASSSNGKGGSVYIDSAGNTFAYGKINTSGIGQNGGYIELSGDKYLAINPNNIIFGKGGTLYLDPKDIIINDGAKASDSSSDSDEYNDSATTSLTLTNGTLEDWLSSGSVTLAANNDLTVNGAITTSGAGKLLTLKAGESIFINANITTGDASLAILANDSSAIGRSNGIAEITMLAGTTIDAGKGNVSITLGNGGDNGDITLENITASKIDIYNNGKTLAHSIIDSNGTNIVSNGSNIIINGALNATSYSDYSTLSTLNGDIIQNKGATINTNYDLYLTAGSENTDGNIILDKGINCCGQVYIPLAYNAWVFGLGSIKMGNMNVLHNLTLIADLLCLFPNSSISQCDSKTVTVGNNLCATAGKNGAIYQGEKDIISVGNDLQFNAGSYISQGDKSTIKVGNNTKLYTTSYIKLENDGNDFCSNLAKTQAQVYIGGSSTNKTIASTSASIKDSTNILRMGDVNVNGDLSLTAKDGDITQCSGTPGTSIIAGATSGSKTTLTSTIGKIDLSNDTNDFKDSVLVNAYTSATIHDANKLQMGSVTTGGDLKLVSGAGTGGAGDLIMDVTSVGGNLSLTANNGNICKAQTLLLQ